MNKLDNLTGIRGYAALWVVLFHYQDTAGLQVLHFGKMIQKGYWGVDIFFVLSGFVISYANRGLLTEGGGLNSTSFKRFLTKRFARIYPLHLFTFAAFVLMFVFARLIHYAIHPEKFSLYKAVLNLFLLHATGLTDMLSWNDPSWSISAEWFAYSVIFFICAQWLNRFNLIALLAVVAFLWSVLFFYFLGSRDISLTHLTYNMGILRILPEFLAGFWLFRYICKHPIRGRGDLWGTVALGGLGAIAYAPLAWEIMLLPLICLLILSLYIGGVWIDLAFGNKTIVWLGEISYSIYLVQILVQLPFGIMLNRLHPHFNVVMATAALMAELGCLLLLAMLAYQYIEVPGRNFLLRRFVNERNADKGSSSHTREKENTRS